MRTCKTTGLNYWTSWTKWWDTALKSLTHEAEDPECDGEINSGSNRDMSAQLFHYFEDYDNDLPNTK
jgi:hypothetical protein